MKDKEKDDLLRYISAEVTLIEEKSISKKWGYVLAILTIFNSLILISQLILWILK